MNRIESQIDGEFTGWRGDTVFRLTNGQVWRQRRYAYHYQYAYRPKVLIYREGSRYKMKVAGVNGELEVERVP